MVASPAAMGESKVPALSTQGPALLANGYRVVPIQPGTKSPVERDWPAIRADQLQLDTWIAQGKGDWGVGILGEETPGIDLDISDEAVLRQVEAFARDTIGANNRRVGRAPRALIATRCDEPFAKLRSKKFRSPDGATHQVEILGRGSQYVAYATHPDTGQPYAWSGEDPATTPADFLPTLTLEKARDLIAHFESIVPADWVPVSTGTDGAPGETSGALRTRLPQAASALKAIPNADLDYDEWLRIGMALKGAVGDEGRELFHEWSERSDKYDVAVTDWRWDTLKPKTIGAGTLFHLASINGWERPVVAAVEEFDVVEGVVGGDAPSGAFFLSYADMVALPEPTWLVDGVLQRGTAALMFGKSNTFKSFLAIDLALCVATGRRWHGRDVQKGRVAIVATEGAVGVGRQRVPGWFDYHGTEHGHRFDIHLHRTEIAIDDKRAVSKLIAEIEAIGGLDLIVLDIFGGTMNGSEVEDTTARAWVQGIQRLLRATGATILTVAHTGWQDQTRARMHTHFWGSFDTRLRVEGDKEKRTSLLTVERHKDADSTGRWPFRLEAECGTLVPQLDATAAAGPVYRLSPAQGIALRALEVAVSSYGEVRSGPGWPTQHVVSITHWRDAAIALGITSSTTSANVRRTFNRAMQDLEKLTAVFVRDDCAWANEAA